MARPKNVKSKAVKSKATKSKKVKKTVVKKKAVKPKSVKTVMVVDDEADVRKSIGTVLKKKGYNVVTAVDGDDCLKKVRKSSPDLILLDIMMPGTPVKHIVPKLKDFKIAFVTVVRPSDAEREVILTKNLVDFIQKPFDIEDLLSRVNKAMKK